MCHRHTESVREKKNMNFQTKQFSEEDPGFLTDVQFYGGFSDEDLQPGGLKLQENMRLAHLLQIKINKQNNPQF